VEEEEDEDTGIGEEEGVREEDEGVALVEDEGVALVEDVVEGEGDGAVVDDVVVNEDGVVVVVDDDDDDGGDTIRGVGETIRGATTADEEIAGVDVVVVVVVVDDVGVGVVVGVADNSL